MKMDETEALSGWSRVGIILGRLIYAGVFGMALTFKLLSPSGTAAYISAAGFPAANLLTWAAILFEIALVLGFLTGFAFRRVCLLASVYVIFLALSFHGPPRWGKNPMEFGFFVDHFTFLAGLLFAAVAGPGDLLVVARRKHADAQRSASAFG